MMMMMMMMMNNHYLDDEEDLVLSIDIAAQEKTRHPILDFYDFGIDVLLEKDVFLRRMSFLMDGKRLALIAAVIARFVCILSSLGLGMELNNVIRRR